MRFELHPADAPRARLGVTEHTGHSARGIAVVAERQHEVATRDVRRHRERAVPELAVQVLGVMTLDPLTASDALVDRTPRGEECGEGAEVGRRDTARPESRGEPRIPRLVDEALGPDPVETGRQDAE